MKELFENNCKRNYVITKKIYSETTASVRIGVMAESEERASSPMLTLDVETEPAS